ncbi:MAG: hypothetical protein ACRDG5_03685 [Anaerolineales bacterium]
MKLLFRLRGLQPDGSIAHFFAANGFTTLERSPTCVVVGSILGRRGPRPSDAATWRAAAASSAVSVAAEVRAVPTNGASRLVAETRVWAGSPSGLLAFRFYWAVVGPFSSLIRRRWLRAAAEGRVAAA